MNNPQLARYLILLTSALLTYFGLGTLINLGRNPEFVGWYAFYALTMFIEAAVLLVCYFRLKARSKTIFWLTVTILVLNIFLTFFDQIGFIDIFFVLLNGVALFVLYRSRQEILPA
mgnify:FL=1